MPWLFQDNLSHFKDSYEFALKWHDLSQHYTLTGHLVSMQVNPDFSLTTQEQKQKQVQKQETSILNWKASNTVIKQV